MCLTPSKGHQSATLTSHRVELKCMATPFSRGGGTSINGKSCFGKNSTLHMCAEKGRVKVGGWQPRRAFPTWSTWSPRRPRGEEQQLSRQQLPPCGGDSPLGLLTDNDLTLGTALRSNMWHGDRQRDKTNFGAELRNSSWEGGCPTPSHGPGGAATHLPQDKTARIPAYLQSKMFCEEGSNFKLFRSEKTQPFSKTFTIYNSH